MQLLRGRVGSVRLWRITSGTFPSAVSRARIEDCGFACSRKCSRTHAFVRARGTSDDVGSVEAVNRNAHKDLPSRAHGGDRPRRDCFVPLAKGHHLTRLETRTKESNMLASIRVRNPSAHRKGMWETSIRGATTAWLP